MQKKPIIDYLFALLSKNLSYFHICDNCLTRFIDQSKDNLSYAEKLSLVNKIKHKKVMTEKCDICAGLTNEIKKFSDIIYESIDEYDFDTFLIGCKIDEDIIEKENAIKAILEDKYYGPIKNWIKREIGQYLEKKLGKTVDFEKPTIMIILDTQFDAVDLQFKPLFIYGRYKKFKRNIPQTRWFCRTCRGIGCRRCDYTGKKYENSVEEMVSTNSLDLTDGTEVIFHGAGREDIDVKMLGNGRPFVIEIKNPKKREIDLEKLQNSINNDFKGIIMVDNLRFTKRDDIMRIKNSHFKKVYKVKIISEEIISIEQLKKASQSLHNISINQFTPTRVSRRRANINREKNIYDCSIESIDGLMVTLIIEAESGTYIKELISGDGGKTQPSLSELVGIPCTVSKLDVIEIKGE